MDNADSASGGSGGGETSPSVPATDYRSHAPFRAAVSRRRFLRVGGTAAGVAIAAGAGTQFGGIARATRAAAATRPHHLTGTIRDLRHVVILMQENRSFDHYFGSLRGVRGFADKQALKYPNGTTIFQQPDTARTDLGYLLPFHMDSAKVNAQNARDLDHSWVGDHSSRNSGLWNNYVPAKTEQTMGYFTRSDLPFQYALADAFTICDGYHQAILAPTKALDAALPARADPASMRSGGQRLSGVRRVAGHVYPGGARRHRGQDAAGSGHHVGHRRGAGKHRDQDVGAGGHRDQGPGPGRPALQDRFFKLRACVSRDDGVPGGGQVRAHGQAHPAQADETNARHHVTTSP